MTSIGARHRREPGHVSNGMTNRVPYIIYKTRPHGTTACEQGHNLRSTGSNEKMELRMVQEEPLTKTVN